MLGKKDEYYFRAYMVDSKLRRNGPIISKASKDFNSLDNTPVNSKIDNLGSWKVQS